MATYYGYAERDVQNQIDWSKVGKDVSDMLATEVQLREEKKAAIEKATQEYGEELSNQPVGQDAEANRILAEFADSAQELRLMQDRLLRSGSIKLKDYNMMRQNTTSGTGNMFDFADEYNEQFELFKKRLDGLGPTGKKSSEIEAWRVEKLGTFATFRNTKPTFNPATGELSLSEMVDDGSGQMVPKEGLSFSSLRNMLYEQTDQFEVLPAAQKISDSFAKTFKIVDPDGKLLTIDDIRNLPDYDKTLNTFVNAELEGNPNAAASILVDYLSYSMDDIDMQWNEQQQTYIPNLTAKQEAEAAGALKQAVEASFQRVETPKPRISSGSGQAARIKAKEKAQEAAEDLTRIMEVFDPSIAGASTAAEAQKARQVALQTLAGARGWKNIVFEKQPDDVIQVIGKNPENQTKIIGIMDPNTTEGMVNWIDQISQSLGLGNMLQARIDTGFDSTKKYSLKHNFPEEGEDERTFTFDLTSERGKEKRQETITAFTNALKKNVLGTNTSGQTVQKDAPMMEDDFIAKIQTPSLTELGIKLVGTGQANEYIKVLTKDNKGKWQEVISERKINSSQDKANELMNDIFELAKKIALRNNDAGLKAWKRTTTVP
jgi:hypothetical protein